MPATAGSLKAAIAAIVRGSIAVVAALLIASAGIWLWTLDRRAGPSAQRVHVRWTADVAADSAARLRAQDALRLTDALEVGPRTWSYRLADRSSERVGRILSHPSVEDTHWLDRARLRVALDQPAFPRWLREILESGQAWLVATMLLVVAALSVWLARSVIAGLRRELAQVARAAYEPARFQVGRVTARIRAVVLLPAPTPPPALEPTWKEVAAGLTMGLILLAPLLLFGPTDQEELGLGVFSSQVFYRDLFEGRWSFWLNDLGFGTPMPIGQRLDFHPVFAMGSLHSLPVALVAVWLVHVALMGVYFLRLQAAFEIRPPIRTILLACYVFSMPSTCYFYQTDWISVIVGWTMFPVVVFYVDRAVHEAGGDGFWHATLRLGLVTGVWVLNAHPGYLASVVIVLAVYVLVLTPLGTRVYTCLLLAALLTAGIAAERIVFTLREMAEFSFTLDRLTQAGYTLVQHARAAAVPFAGLPADPRGPFVGIVVGLSALALVVRAAWESNRRARAAAVAFAVAGALTLVPLEYVASLRTFSAIWLFRDAMVFFAILAGGVALQRGLDTFRPSWRKALWCCVVVQVVQQGIAVAPGVWRVVEEGRSQLLYRNQNRATGLAALLARRAAAYGSRLYVSTAILDRMRGHLADEGLSSNTDLVFLGINPVNGVFKGVAMDRIYPSPALTRGMIDGEQDVIENDALLDVLGIDLIMMEAGDGPLPSTLRLTDRLQPSSLGLAHDIYLLANPDAWPRAVLLDRNAPTLDLPFRPGCPHRGALCRDYAPLATARRSDPVRLSAADGEYTARFDPSDDERLLFLSVFGRPEWQAAAGFRIVPIAGAFIGVVVPAGADEVQLRFVPRVRIALAWFSTGLLAVVLVAVVVGTLRRRMAYRSRA